MSIEAVIGIIGAALALIGVVIPVVMGWDQIRDKTLAKISVMGMLAVGTGLILLALGILIGSSDNDLAKPTTALQDDQVDTTTDTLFLRKRSRFLFFPANREPF